MKHEFMTFEKKLLPGSRYGNDFHARYAGQGVHALLAALHKGILAHGLGQDRGERVLQSASSGKQFGAEAISRIPSSMGAFDWR